MADIVEKIRAAFEREQANPRKAVNANDVPGTYEAFTPEWLTAIVCAKTPGAKVTSFSLDKKDDGSSSRRRVFLTYNDAGKKADLPPSVFCKLAAGLPQRVVLGASGSARDEVNFFNLVRPRLAIEAPVAIHARFDPETYAQVVMLKDMGQTAEFCKEDTVIDWDRAVSLVNLLARFHSTFYEHPDLGTAKMPFRTWPEWWNNTTTAFDFAAFCDKAFVDAERVIPPRLFKRRAEIWPCTQKSVERHRQLPRTFVHDDVHLRNWYLTSKTDMGLTDWQCVTVGNWARDYIYAVTCCLSVENRRKWDKQLLTLYLDKMAEYGVPRISYEEAFNNTRQQLFSALAFWTITLRPTTEMTDMQPESATYLFIERFCAAIDDYDAVDSFK